MRILLSGYNGAMGRVVADLSHEIVAGYSNHIREASFPVYTNLSEINETFDIILDFSHPSALKDLLNFAVARKVPCVIAATGLNASDFQMIDLASSHIPILQANNFSRGVNALVEITEVLVKLLSEYDIEIIEKHHALKQDAPSGTALMLADAIMGLRHDPSNLKCGREGLDARRVQNEIGIHSVRGGTVVGEHSVVFAGEEELIEIKHTAYSKKIFAKGALDGCAYLVNQKPGRYSMKDVLNHD